jgi:phage gp29-like protein
VAEKNKNQINKKEVETLNHAETIVIKRERTYPADALTPSKLADALKEANKGNISTQAELFSEMAERDADLGSALSTRRNVVAGLDYSILPADESAQAVKAADAAKVMLEEYLTNFRGGLKMLLAAVGQGFSVCEINWELIDGLLYPIELIPIEHRFFTFRYDDKLQRTPRMLTEREQEQGEELPPYKYIVHKYTGLSGIIPRDGLVRQCAYLYLFKNYGLKDWMSFLDRYGIPMRIGKYSPAASTGAVETLKRAVLGLGSDAAALISDATTIEVLDIKAATTDMFEKAQEYLAKKIDKVILGHTGAAEATPGKLGNEQKAVEVQDILKLSDASELAQTIRQQLLYPFTLLNFGEACPVPIFEFDTNPPEDEERTARVIATLAQAGLTSIPTAWLHEKFGIPLPAKGEQTLGDLRPTFQSPLTLKANPKAVALSDTPPSPSALTSGEKLIDLLPREPIQNAFDAEMEEIIKVLLSIENLEEAEEILAKRFSGWSESELTEKIAHGLYIARLAGASDD